MASIAFRGIYTALVTPFDANGKVDEKAFQSFVDWQIKEGIHGVVPVGTTGESPTLTHEEHMRVIELCVEVAKGRVPVLAGTGSNATAEAIEFTRHAKKAGADGALVVAPYYNKPTQEGLYQHYKAIAEAVDLPIIIYNIPGRSVVNITDETLARLAKFKNIVGVKDATGDLSRVSTLNMALKAAGVTDPFHQLSGEDMTALAFNAAGGVGCISVTSNIAPKLCAQLQEATFKNDYATAHDVQARLAPVHQVMFCESSPAPVKYALSLMGKCSPSVRLPLVPLSDAARPRVEQALKHAKLV